MSLWRWRLGVGRGIHVCGGDGEEGLTPVRKPRFGGFRGWGNTSTSLPWIIWD